MKSLGNGEVYFKEYGLKFQLADYGNLSHPPHGDHVHGESDHNTLDGPVSYDSYTMTFRESQRPECIEGKGERLTKVNYLRGKSENSWHNNISTYESVLYGGIYEGIDAIFTQDNHQLKYDFHVAAHACPEQIQLEYNIENIALENGVLVITTEVGYVQELKPFAY
ncbi:MAG: hypothetical protein AAF843_14975, partial [Bacteroidota bacterium]